MLLEKWKAEFDFIKNFCYNYLYKIKVIFYNYFYIGSWYRGCALVSKTKEVGSSPTLPARSLAPRNNKFIRRFNDRRIH